MSQTQSPSGFTLNPPPALAPADLVTAFTDVVTPHISDNLDRLPGITGLQRYHAGRKLVGTAFTVKVRPGDNLLIYKALMQLQPGHVLVVDGGGELVNALIGELILQYAQQRGCVGFVIDGAIRDSAAFYKADFPCYARGVSHRGPYKTGPGSLNVPVSIAGQVVQPGDLVVGDEDGVVTFPVAQAPALLDAARRSATKEAAVMAEIATGRVDQSWLTATLAPFGLL
ncbi:MAG: RraA family protein [Proteobacteria bacterium]|jgi:RraA family protein|nr:RraA family protein [Ramlibacter sp.]MCA0214924.1 RraA family protein [Pseudomonadota bacterium]